MNNRLYQLLLSRRHLLAATPYRRLCHSHSCFAYLHTAQPQYTILCAYSVRVRCSYRTDRFFKFFFSVFLPFQFLVFIFFFLHFNERENRKKEEKKQEEKFVQNFYRRKNSKKKNLKEVKKNSRKCCVGTIACLCVN